MKNLQNLGSSSYRRYKVGNYYFSSIEIRDLAKALAAVSFAFAIASTGGLFGKGFFSAFIISAFTVGIGFIFHELGHKFLAQKYGCKAEFRSFDYMLIFAIILAFTGFIFAAPGAVVLGGKKITKQENGKISAMGPLMNIILALMFFGLSYFSALFFGSAILSLILYYGFMLNSLLALFNMLPFGNFDGLKVFYWNKVVYGIMLVVSALLMAGAYIGF